MQYNRSKKFDKIVSKIKDKWLLTEIDNCINEIEVANDVNEIKNLKKMKGFSNPYRIKIKDYRLCFYLNENKIELEKIAHRKDVYNDFP